MKEISKNFFHFFSIFLLLITANAKAEDKILNATVKARATLNELVSPTFLLECPYLATLPNLDDNNQTKYVATYVPFAQTIHTKSTDQSILLHEVMHHLTYRMPPKCKDELLAIALTKLAEDKN